MNTPATNKRKLPMPIVAISAIILTSIFAKNKSNPPCTTQSTEKKKVVTIRVTGSVRSNAPALRSERRG